MDKFLSLLWEIVSFLKKYGVSGVFIIIVLCYGLNMLTHIIPENVFTKDDMFLVILLYLAIKSMVSIPAFDKDNLNFQMKKRRNANYKVNTSLLRLKNALGANRAFIFEFHNGKHNTSKLGFTYADMVYEEFDDGMTSIYKQYQDMPLSIFKIADHLFENHVMIGELNGIKAIDKHLYVKLEEYGTVSYIGAVLLKSEGKPIGVLGVSYSEKPKMTLTKIKEILSFNAQDFGDYLDLKKC